jgi:hypothetical protein
MVEGGRNELFHCLLAQSSPLGRPLGTLYALPVLFGLDLFFASLVHREIKLGVILEQLSAWLLILAWLTEHLSILTVKDL